MSEEAAAAIDADAANDKASHSKAHKKVTDSSKAEVNGYQDMDDQDNKENTIDASQIAEKVSELFLTCDCMHGWLVGCCPAAGICCGVLAPCLNHAMHAVQEGRGNKAVATPGSAYGASPLGPSTGGFAGNSPGSADAQTGTELEPMHSQPLQDGDTAQDSDNQKGGEQQGLALPFEPVALVFKDVHYFVKHPDGKSSELELLQASFN